MTHRVDPRARRVDAEQGPNGVLHLVVASLAEVPAAEGPVGVVEVERRPVPVGPAAPDDLVGVEHHGIADPLVGDELGDGVGIAFVLELGCVDRQQHEAVGGVPVVPCGGVAERVPTVDAAEGPEVVQHDATCQVGVAVLLVGEVAIDVQPPRPAGHRRGAAGGQDGEVGGVAHDRGRHARGGIDRRRCGPLATRRSPRRRYRERPSRAPPDARHGSGSRGRARLGRRVLGRRVLGHRVLGDVTDGSGRGGDVHGVS